MWVRSPGQEDLLEEEMAPHSSILAWKIPGTEEPGERQSLGSQRVRHDSANENTCTDIKTTLRVSSNSVPRLPLAQSLPVYPSQACEMIKKFL